MNTKMFNAIYDYYKEHYDQIEERELYKWEAVVHFRENWNLEAADFPAMLKNSLSMTENLLHSGNYFPARMIVWLAEREPEKVRDLFRMLFDLSLDIKER